MQLLSLTHNENKTVIVTIIFTGWLHWLQLKKHQLHTNHVIPDSKTHGLHVAERSTVKDGTCLMNDEKRTHHRHTNSADEGIAELDGPTNIPVLLELLREKDDRIQVLGENITRVRVDKQVFIPFILKWINKLFLSL